MFTIQNMNPSYSALFNVVPDPDKTHYVTEFVQ